MPSHEARADAIRFLSIDAVEKAKSGHPGMPMGMAQVAEVLWHDFLQHNPTHPHWFNRDRFVLSNGHGSMLLYALLHLTGYDLSIDDIRQFRQLHSKTPGHPEYGETPGVETTTGPLGQGFGNAVGMAIAESHLAALFNRPHFQIVDHYTYCFVGDGCLMEGISHEVASLAGVLKLGKLIVFYDDNGISIDGDVSGWFRDNTPMRFKAYGWHVIESVAGQDIDTIHQAIKEAQSVKDQPSLICCKTTIGWGSPNKAGTAQTHGAALGEEEVTASRVKQCWIHAPFVIPDDLYRDWDARGQGQQREQAWLDLLDRYQKKYPDLANNFKRYIEGELPKTWDTQFDAFVQHIFQKKESIATRKASELCLNYFTKILPEMLGGSADLTESNCTLWKGADIYSAEQPSGHYIHYGVREFGMSAIMNGMALHKGIIPFGGTFLTFSDYARNAVRLAAMMKAHVIFVYSHDSIGLGEDGPTHQPIEQLPSLRLIPELSVWRPCDLIETAYAWRFALEHAGPTALLFSRQALPYQERKIEQCALIARGGYILQDSDLDLPDVILIATGSEVALAIETAIHLNKADIRVRVVSMPSVDVFLKQDEHYRKTVLPDQIKARLVIEAARGDDWYPMIGPYGRVIGLDRYGASAPAKDVFRDCGLTVDHVVKVAKTVIDYAQHVQA